MRETNMQFFFSQNKTENIPFANGGFTLLEIALALSIGAMLTLMLASCFVVIFETETRVTGARELREQSTQVMDFITKKIRNADSITAPASLAVDQAFSFVSLGATEESSFSLHDGRLWFVDEGSAESAVTSTGVTVLGFSVANLTQGARGGTLHIRMHLAMPLPTSSPNARMADYIINASATMRSQEIIL